MKRAKKAIVSKREVSRYIYEVTCPHCKTTLVGGINDEILRMKCCQCAGIIELIHEEST